MKEDAVTHQVHVEPPLAFRLFKYTIYLLLSLNVFLFFREDVAAAQEMMGDHINWKNLVEAYSATIDTAAWVVLLLLFELETAVIPDNRLIGGLKWLLMAIRSVAYFFIVWSFWGYCVKYGMVSSLDPIFLTDACSLVGTDFTFVFDLDEYLPIDQSVCTVLNGQDLWQVRGTEIIGSTEALLAARNLAIVDIINAGDWLLIVLMLEIEVLLQLRHRLSDRLIRVFKYLKIVLYSILLMAAVYWWFLGDFLDFWDAFLWLVAFIFIEMNIFQWHAEVEEEIAQAEKEAGSDASITSGT